MSESNDRPPRALKRRTPFGHALAMSVGRPICHFLLRLLYRVRVEGEAFVPIDGPLIIIANHQSYLDPILVGLLARRRPFRAIARSGMFRFKALAWLMNMYGAIALDQDRGDIAAFRVAIEEINRGRALVIYPEGGRTRDGTAQPFARGFHLVLKRTGAAVLPVFIEGAYDVWPSDRGLPRLHGRIMVRAAPPISAAQIAAADPNELLPALRRYMEEGRLQLRAEMRETTSRRYPVERRGDRAYWDQ